MINTTKENYLDLGLAPHHLVRFVVAAAAAAAAVVVVAVAVAAVIRCQYFIKTKKKEMYHDLHAQCTQLFR